MNCLTVEEQIRDILVEELKKDFVIKKRFCNLYGINERVFRDIISKLAQDNTPILSLSSFKGYKIAQYVGEKEEDDLTDEMVLHQINELESRIKVLRKRKKVLKKFLESRETPNE